MSKEEIHVAMLPWSAFGHLVPFLELSIALAKSGIHVSFISTPKIIQRLPKIPPNLSTLIKFVPIPFPKLGSDLLPESAEATVDIPADKIEYLKFACDLLHEPVKTFLAEKKQDWIIVDFFPHWAVDISRDLNIPIVIYYVFNATTIAFLGAQQEKSTPDTWTETPELINDISSNIAFKKHEAEIMHPGVFGKNVSGISDSLRTTKLLHACKAIAIRTCPEFEGVYLEIMAKDSGKLIIPVGFLPPEKITETSRKKTAKEEASSGIIQWLDEQKPSSVVFVGFGSECKLNKEQIHEIAHGVELSNLSFLWALRKPEWADEESEILPHEFLNRTAGRGVVHVGWAPQREILAHPSIGGSLFHGGWGSIIETLQYGHCLVLLPFIADQPLNARVLVEKGLGIEIEKAEDGSFSRNDIAKALQKAMVLEDGEEYRVRAREAGIGIFGDEKLHDSYVKKFVEYLKNDVGQHDD